MVKSKLSIKCDFCVYVDTCPFGEDERNCIRLSSTNGDLGRGTLEIYKANKKRWEPACIRNWDGNLSTKVCSMLGYGKVDFSRVFNRATNHTMDPNKDMRMTQRKSANFLRDSVICNDSSSLVVELTCTQFECGKIRTKRRRLIQKRIVGGKESKPGASIFN